MGYTHRHLSHYGLQTQIDTGLLDYRSYVQSPIHAVNRIICWQTYIDTVVRT